MPGTYHGKYCHSEHKQHSPQIGTKGWAKSINHVSYWASWFWKKHCHEGSTAVYDFCLAVGVMWSDHTFLFTAYTGAAASLFGGVTISKATFLNQQKALSLSEKNEWQDVQILIVDEVSFMSDKILEALDVKLKEIGNSAKPFVGFSIILAGDFHQLEPVGSTEFDLMFSSLSSKHWDNCINAIIVLDNIHCFKEDPEYDELLKRMWNGVFSTEDRKRINTRVIGYNGLQLPSHVKGEIPKC
jgi:hypothetical protein